MLERSPRDGDSLLLAARQLHAALTDRRLVAVRQAHYELVEVSQAGRLLNLLLRAAVLAEGDVVADRVVEQHGVLRNHGNRLAHGRQRHLRYRRAIEQNAAGVRFEQARDESDDCRLAGAARPDDAERLACRDAEADAVENGTVRTIGH